MVARIYPVAFANDDGDGLVMAFADSAIANAACEALRELGLNAVCGAWRQPRGDGDEAFGYLYATVEEAIADARALLD